MKIPLSIQRFGFGAVAALVLTSCLSEMPRPFPTQPDQPTFVPSFSPVVTTSLPVASSRLTSNRIKYSNAGQKPAVAAVGNVSLQFRALLGRDGVTSIEATTGIFEERAGTDVIQRALMRVLSAPTAEPVQAWPNATYWSHDMVGLVRGDQLHLQANVKGSGVSRTEILRLTDTVALRPDLAVVSLDGAAIASTNMPVPFFATIAELNGDWGARADCVLSVNGTAVDQATGIWVDAGDVVSCQFAYVFEVAGTYTVSLSAGNVRPGDWDTANNIASRSITIVTPGTPVAHGQIDAFEEEYQYLTTTTRTGDYPIDASSGGTQSVSKVNFFGKATEVIPAPVQRIDAVFSAGTRTVHEATLTQFQTFQFNSGGARVTCATYTNMNQHDAMSCTSRWPDGTGKTQMSYNHSSGTVTYYGQTLWCNLSGCNTFGGPWSGSTVTGSGQRYGLAAGQDLRVRLTYVDAVGDARVVDKLVTMNDVSGQVNFDVTSCNPNHWEGLGTVCTRRQSSGMLLQGKLTWGNPFGP